MSTLVTNPAEVEANTVRFPSELESSSALQDRLSYARAWYAFPHSKGGWSFVPSKFGGYKDMTAFEYLDGSPRDGRRTESQLDQWFIEVQEEDELHAELYAGLVAFLDCYGKIPSTKARISVLADFYLTDEEPDDKADAAIVDLILQVAKKLPKQELARLRAAL